MSRECSGWLRDPRHGRRSRRQWSSWTRLIRRCAGSARSRRSRQGRTTSQDSPSPPTSESRPTFFMRTRDGDCLAPLVRRGRWSPSDATALSTRAQAWGPSGSRRSTRRRSRRSRWRRSVSAPPAGIYSTRRGRGPTKGWSAFAHARRGALRRDLAEAASRRRRAGR